MSFVEFDKPSSWSLVASETGESTKCPWVGVVEGTAGSIFRFWIVSMVVMQTFQPAGLVSE